MPKIKKLEPTALRSIAQVATLATVGAICMVSWSRPVWSTGHLNTIGRQSALDPQTGPAGPTGGTETPASELELDDQAQIEKALADARTAIIAMDYPAAVRLLTKVLSFPENSSSADAQELLGLVRERNGQFAHAKAEYEIYLEKYPQSDGTARVEQRLAGILTAEAAQRGPLRGATGELIAVSSDPDAGDPRVTNFEQIRVERPSPKLVFRIPAPNPDGGTEDADEYPIIESWGSVGATYFFNQGTTVLTEFETNRETKDDFIFQNSLVTSLEYQRSYEDQDRKFTYRISGSSEVDFVEGFSHDLHISRLYGEFENKETGLTIKAGRQTLYSAGVFGRFDGVRLSWAVNDGTTLHVQAGSPVDSVRDPLFQFDRTMFGVSADFHDLLFGADLTVYAIGQLVGSEVNRQAVGVEIEHTTETTSLAGIFDFDTYFGRVNFARVTGTKIFENRSSLTLSLDYVLSPYLTLTNALQGQTAATIGELLTLFTPEEVKQLALDRTTTSASATAAYFRPLNDKWQLSLDGTVFYTKGNPASGGVAAIPAPGADYFVSAGVYGTGIFRERDVINATVRLADTSSSTLYLVDSYYRFPANEKLRLRPRIKVGYRDLKSTGGHEIFAIPSITADFELNEQTTFEIEIGDRFSLVERPGSSERSNEIYAFIGVRREF